jgi:hypothetical protein
MLASSISGKYKLFIGRIYFYLLFRRYFLAVSPQQEQ